MNRFMGLMPSDEVTIQKTFKDRNGRDVRIQAGPHGWTVIYADGGTNYKDTDASDDENFNTAYNVAVETLGELTEECSSMGCRRCVCED